MLGGTRGGFRVSVEDGQVGIEGGYLTFSLICSNNTSPFHLCVLYFTLSIGLYSVVVIFLTLRKNSKSIDFISVYYVLDNAVHLLYLL